MRVEYEDPLVKVAGLLGGEEYIKVARALLNNEDSTDEEIASATGLKINTVRKVLYDLYSRSLISGIRVRDLKRGWYVYRWRAQREQVDSFVAMLKKKIVEKLEQRLAYEEQHEFYHCNNPSCPKRTFEQALELFFRCPNCGATLNRVDSGETTQLLKWKIQQIESEK
jgi:transcription initiation factor TFIIE subunit alpha